MTLAYLQMTKSAETAPTSARAWSQPKNDPSQKPIRGAQERPPKRSAPATATKIWLLNRLAQPTRLKLPNPGDHNSQRLDASCYWSSHLASMSRTSAAATNEPAADSPAKASLKTGSRKVPRISITVSQSIHDLMIQECTSQGRSLSNLASFWIKQQAENLAREQGKTLPED